MWGGWRGTNRRSDTRRWDINYVRWQVGQPSCWAIQHTPSQTMGSTRIEYRTRFTCPERRVRYHAHACMTDSMCAHVYIHPRFATHSHTRLRYTCDLMCARNAHSTPTQQLRLSNYVAPLTGHHSLFDQARCAHRPCWYVVRCGGVVRRCPRRGRRCSMLRVVRLASCRSFYWFNPGRQYGLGGHCWHITVYLRKAWLKHKPRARL